MLKKCLPLLFCLFNVSAYADELAKKPENMTASVEPVYKISDTDIKIFVRQVNNIEQCIYPNLAKRNYQKIYDSWSISESMAMKYFQLSVLRELVGEKNLYTIEHDEASKRYFQQQQEKFNNQIAHVNPESCQQFKLIYQEIKQKMEAELPLPYRR